MSGYEKSELRQAIRIMAHANNNTFYLHSETLNDIANMGDLTNDQLVNLHWEVYHAING